MAHEVGSPHPNDIAQWFIGHTGPFVHATGAAFHYNAGSGVWQPLEENELCRDIFAFDNDIFWMEDRGRGVRVRVPIRISPHQVDQVARSVMLTRFPDDLDFIRNPGRGIAFPNGYLEILGIGPSLRANGPRNYATTSLPFAYDPAALCPAFDAMMARIFAKDDAGDAAAKNLCLAAFVGACLFGRATDFEICLLLLGGGSNGKSTFIKIMQDLFFRGKSRAISPDKWDHEYYLAQLHQALVNMVSELPTARFFASERFKQIITGDTVTGRNPAEKPFDFRPRAGHIFSANELPTTGDVTLGFFRRFRLIPFTNDFATTSDGGRNLYDAVMLEAPGVLNWAIRGLVQALTDKTIVTPPSHERILDEWRRGADAVMDFMQNCCTRDEGFTSVSQLYPAYQDWAEATGHKEMTTVRFGRRLTALGIEKHKRADNTHYKLSLRDRQYWIDVGGGGRVEKKSDVGGPP